MESQMQQTSEHCQPRPNTEPRAPFTRLPKEMAVVNRLARKMNRARTRRNKLAKDIGVLERYGIMGLIRECQSLSEKLEAAYITNQGQGQRLAALEAVNAALSNNIKQLAEANNMQRAIEQLSLKLGIPVNVVEVHKAPASAELPKYGENHQD